MNQVALFYKVAFKPKMEACWFTLDVGKIDNKNFLVIYKGILRHKELLDFFFHCWELNLGSLHDRNCSSTEIYSESWDV